MESPLGTLTIMFEDLEGSTAFVTARGDDAWQAIQAEHNKVFRAAAGENAGTDVHFLGDGYMVAFRAGEQAIACAVAIQRVLEQQSLGGSPGLRARIGLHTGPVSRNEGGHLVGAAVHAASRVCSKAAGGQVLVSENVRRETAAVPGIVFADRGLFWLKGFPERWRLHEVLWREGTAGTVQGPAGRTALVGRDEEMSDLRRLLEAATGGRGQVALIGGEPGVGKTRLADELMAEARAQGMTVLSGNCYAMGSPPYVPIVEILEAAAELLPADLLRSVLGDAAPEVARIWPEVHRRLPNLAAPLSLPPEQAQRYLFNSLAEVIQRLSRTSPLVLLLDDLQWADPSTLLLVQHLSRRIGNVPVLMIGAYREVEVGTMPSLGEMLESLARQPAVQQMTLRRLTRGAVGGLIRGLAGKEPPPALVDVVYPETEGNPFFVEAVYLYLRDEGKLFDAGGAWRDDITISEVEVPQSVRLLLEHQLSRLSEETRRILTTVAVAGRGVKFRLLEQLEADNAEALFDALDEAEAAHLLAFTPQAADTQVQFAHELIRQTLIAELPTTRRQRTHLRVARAMQSLGGDDGAEAPDLAYHLLQAGPLADAAETVRYLQIAAIRALDASAFHEALRHFRGALDMKPENEHLGADLSFGLARALRSLGRWDEAVQAWQLSIDTYRRLGDREAAGRACWYAAEQLNWIARWDEAMLVTGVGLSALGDLVNADRARLTANAAVMLSAGGHGEAAEQMLSQARELACELGDDQLLGYVMNLTAVHSYFSGRPNDAVEVGLRAAELLRSAGDLWNLANVLSFVSLALGFAADFVRVGSVADEAASLAGRLGHLSARWLAERGRWTEVLTGALDGFERFVDRDAELIRDLPWVSGSFCLQGVVAFRRGRWNEALALFEQAVEREVGEALRSGDHAMVMLVAAYAGDRDRAMTIYRAQQGALPRPGGRATIGGWTLVGTAVEALWILGECDEAAGLYPAVLAAKQAGLAVRTWDGALHETVAGMAAAAGYRWDVAETHFARALDLAERMPHLVEQAEVRRHLARMLIERGAEGDRDQAVELLGVCADTYRSLGMPEHERLARAMLESAA